MPSRYARNGRNKQHNSTHVYQQPTPSSRPSPDAFRPSSLSDDSTSSSSGEDGVGRSSTRSKQNPRGGGAGNEVSDWSPSPVDVNVAQFPSLVDISPDLQPERSLPPHSLPTPPLPEASHSPALHQPQPALPLALLREDSVSVAEPLRSPILASM
ncbi:hypothetical protein D9757_009653 [Collybiopsis confluens]|uniref:Uncharacterized protein n=1 Tax=Collybiopsis confluens TaxID=2823264 RepID=A0A8H5LWM7_9AGAR|nr:hypothetical protein D9757_009653 [Collybiopsis confluens]